MILLNNEYIRKLYVIGTYYLCQYFAYSALTAIVLCHDSATGNENIPFADKGLLTQTFYITAYCLKGKDVVEGSFLIIYNKTKHSKQTPRHQKSKSNELFSHKMKLQNSIHMYEPHITRKERMHRRIAFRTYHMQ